ncbi:MAG TPA: ATP-dependent protease ATPase subunit HslU [Candidatus Dormibacteraeota bacterium]|nr:ATP-dependent protease ATPase subunit HslU [Candidatus Dormibacteraeota bacterium]
MPAASREELRPVEIVRRLDEYIVGQQAAKRAVAIALRNRIRRQRLTDEMREEVLPKNILMIGPTGVGKTEIARRLARLTNSPFLKVEATKFTEVGYVGRDVESIVRDLLEQTISEVHNGRIADVEERARETAGGRILDTLVAAEAPTKAADGVPEDEAAGQRKRRAVRRRLERRLAARQLEDRLIDIDVEEPFQPAFEGFAGTGLEEVGTSLSDFFSQMAPPRKRTKRMTVADARTALVEEETDRLIDMDRVYDDAIRDVEDDGIVFVDEMDKICGQHSEHGPDVSGEGVQRDLLPLLEGSTVSTRYGPVHTDHILFIAAGAFTMSRPSDLIPEMQGRFPIRVELSSLSESDLQRILVEPSNALTRQYTALLGTEGVELRFSEDGISEIAHQAHAVNEQDENIGARRLFTVLEKVLEEVSFRAEDFTDSAVDVDAGYVRARLADLVRNDDLRRFVL